MALTKLEARGLIQELIDDASAKMWGTSLLDRLATTTIDALWGELLEINPRLLVQTDTITTLQSPGFLRLALTTDTPAGDLSQRFRRIQHITRDGREYTEIRRQNVVVEDNEVGVNDARQYGWYRKGKQIWLVPFETTPEVEFEYNYLPTKFSALADGDAVEWPEGFEDAYTWEVAGRAMLKGGRENAESHLAIAGRAMANLKSLVRDGKLILPQYHMTAQEMGGE